MKLDPLMAANDASKPLISKLLAVPALRERYLGYVREVAERWLDWGTLGPLVAQHHARIADAVKADTKKLSSYEAFENSIQGTAEAAEAAGPHRSISLKQFAEQRRAYVVALPAAGRAVSQ